MTLDLRGRFVEADARGALLDQVQQEWAAGSAAEDVAPTLAALQDSGEIDLCSAFVKLRRLAPAAHDFFLLRHYFELAIPEFAKPPSHLLPTVSHLLTEAGDDIAAGTILNPYSVLLSRHESWAVDALAAIESGPIELFRILSAVLDALAVTNRTAAVDSALRLTESDTIEAQGSAAFALGRLSFDGDVALASRAFAGLERVLTLEPPASVRATVLLALTGSNFDKHIDEGRRLAAVESACSVPSDLVTHASADALARNGPSTSLELREVLLREIGRLKPGNIGSVRTVDWALSRLLAHDREQALTTLERLLLSNWPHLKVDAFPSLVAGMRADVELRQLVVTRWVLRKRLSLAMAAAEIVPAENGKSTLWRVHEAELPDRSSPVLMFAVEKIVGFLFAKPRTAASLALSLTRYVEDETVRAAIGQLVYDILYLNYPAAVTEVCQMIIDSGESPVAGICKEIVAAGEAYWSALEAAAELRALTTPTENRETYGRFMQKEMAEVWTKAVEQSQFLKLMPRRTLLFGRSAIAYATDESAFDRRIETPLVSHSTSADVPRLSVFDPTGLEHALRRLRLSGLSE